MIRPFRGVHPQIHPTAYVDPSAQVIGDVHLGEEASIWCNCTVRGDIHFIRIGDRANVQDNSVIHVRQGTHPTILEEIRSSKDISKELEVKLREALDAFAKLFQQTGAVG